MKTIDATQYPALQIDGALDPGLVEGSVAIVAGPEDQIQIQWTKAENVAGKRLAVYAPSETPRALLPDEELVRLTW